MTKLQIFIPSYKREESLKHLLEQALAEKIHEQAHIHVTDDGVCGWDFLKQMQDGGFISVNHHRENQGYAFTLFEALADSSDDYVALTNDDDFIIKGGIQEIIAKLEGEYADRFDFISTNYRNLTGVTVRGGPACSIDLLSSRNFSQHAPGLIFKVSAVRALVDFVSGRLNVNCQFTKTYPQVALLWGVLLFGGAARHESISVVQEGFSLPSQLRFNGRSYIHPVARVEQKFAAIEFLDEFKNRFEVNQMKHAALMEQERRSLGYIFYDSLRQYDADLSKIFATSVFKERVTELIKFRK